MGGTGKAKKSPARTYIRIAGDPEVEGIIKKMAKDNYRNFGQEARRLLRLQLGLDSLEDTEDGLSKKSSLRKGVA